MWAVAESLVEGLTARNGRVFKLIDSGGAFVFSGRMGARLNVGHI